MLHNENVLIICKMFHRYSTLCMFFHTVLLSTPLKGDNNNASIKLRTIKDLEAWRYLQMQAKQDYNFRKRVMNYPKICPEPINCEESFMTNQHKEQLLDILNKQRNHLVEKSCEKVTAFELIWFWKAEINATINALGCQEGLNQTDVILDGDLNTTKYFRKAAGFEIHPGEETFWNSTNSVNNRFPIRERVQCYTLSYEYILNITTVDYFLKMLETEFWKKYNVSKCISEKIPYSDSTYVGCSLTLTQVNNPNKTNAYFNCYYCDRNITNPSSEYTSSTDCPDGTKKSKEYPHLCQDIDIKNSFIDELITRQYDCGRFAEFSRGLITSKLNVSIIVCLLLLKIKIV